MPVRKLIEAQVCLGSWVDRMRKTFRYGDVDPQRRDLDHREKSVTRSRVDQCANVRVTARYYPVERRSDHFKVLQRSQPFYVGLVRGDGGLLDLKVAGRIVNVLPRNDVPLEQLFVAIVRRTRKVECGMSRLEISARLVELLIDSRSVEFRQHLSTFHFRANVEVPFFHVPTGLGEDRSLSVCSRFSRKL